MKVEHLRELVAKLDKNDEVYCLFFGREDANDYAEQVEQSKPTDEEWSQIVRYMDTDDGIYEEAQGSFVWAMDKMIEKRSVENENRPILA